MGISREQALDCLRSDDLIGIGMEADAVRRRLHPEGVVSYAMEAAVACAQRAPDAIYEEIARAEDKGAAAIVLGGGMALKTAEMLLAGIRQRFPGLRVQGFSAPELAAFGPDGIQRLRDAGLDAIGGAAPETPDEAWIEAQRAAHRAGMTTTAGIVFGAGETFEERLDSLEAIRRLQAETGGFAALAPIGYHSPGGRELDETTAVEYLKTLAVARMYVETIENLQADWTTQGLKVLQMGLRFGANDAGSVQVQAKRGATEEELRRIIRDAGFKPALRDLGYRVMALG